MTLQHVAQSPSLSRNSGCVPALGRQIPRIDRLCCVLATIATLCASPDTAYAQLTSIHAIRYVTLAPPPPGMEKLHHDLAEYWRGMRMLVEAPETLDDRLARHGKTIDTREALNIDPRARCARCRLRADFPQPRAIGLECSDYANNYVGAVRAGTAGELIRWVSVAYQTNLSGAKPLHTVRALVSGQSSSHVVSRKTIELMKQLLRTDGSFRVLDSDDGVVGDEHDSLLRFDLNPNAFSVNGTAFFRLSLKDRFGNWARVFDVERPRRGIFFVRSDDATLRRLVDLLLRARIEDEEIYRVPQLK